MTATVFISTLQHSGYEYGAAPHTSVSSNTLPSAHPSAIRPGNNLFKCQGGGLLGLVGGVCGGAMSFVSLVIGVTTNSTFGLNQHHLDASADGGRARSTWRGVGGGGGVGRERLTKRPNKDG